MSEPSPTMQVVMSAELMKRLEREYLAPRDMYLFPISVSEKDLPTYGIATQPSA